MANAQVGNLIGVAQIGPLSDSKLAEITADGAGTITVAVADVPKFRIGQLIRVRNKSTGGNLASRTVTGITSAGVITYSGADMATIPGTHAVYEATVPSSVNSVGTGGQVNLNGGFAARAGYWDADFSTIQGMRDALAAAVPATYTDTYLDAMTENDMRFALRQLRNPVGARGY